MSKTNSNDLIKSVEKLFEKAPVLPANVKETLVNFMPFIALIFGIIGIFGSIGGLGLFAMFSPIAVLGGVSGVSSFGMGSISVLFWLGSSVMLLAAYPGVKAKKIGGWNLLFWGEVVSLIGSLVSMSFVSGLISAAIGFYLLFQIKSYYK